MGNLFPELQDYWNANSSRFVLFSLALTELIRKRYTKSMRDIRKYTLDSGLITRHLTKVLSKFPEVLGHLLTSSPLLLLFRTP